MRRVPLCACLLLLIAAAPLRAEWYSDARQKMGTKVEIQLWADSEAAAKRNVRDAIESVAARLGNTPTICRQCYVHPQIIDAYLADELRLELADTIDDTLTQTDLRPEETQVLRFLKKRLKT